jgi:decaprenylphospho-beta-D-ribofuranose 2-oxidase
MTVFAGWGQSMRSISGEAPVSDVADLRELLSGAHPRGITCRGLGRSYGDSSLNSGGTVCVTRDDSVHKRIRNRGNQASQMGGLYALELDSLDGTARVGAAVSIEDLLRVSIPQGWFVPVTPGTRFVTIGGAIAADVHGKNHHRDGTFGQHVKSMTVLMSNSEVVTLDPTQNKEWFWATIGGMGLTGIVLEATIQMISIPGPHIAVDTQRVSKLEDLISLMNDVDADDAYRYSVAWVDTLARGQHFGRGVLTRGNHVATAGDSNSGSAQRYEPRSRAGVPRGFPRGVLNKASIRAFNEMWFQKAPHSVRRTSETVSSFFHPLDGIRHWNRMYGSRGFLQYQFVVPPTRGDVVRTVMEMMQEARLPTFLGVLKRFGPTNEAFLSFPMQGLTLAVDIAVGSPQLARTLHACDELVISAGGRHYLAKDSHMSKSTFRAGYPELQHWQAIRDEMDPTRLWISDQARRLDVRGDEQ